MARNAYLGVSGSTAQILSAKGVLEGMFVSSVGSSGTMMIYDDVYGSATTLINTFTLAAGYTYLGSIECGTGVYVETNGAPIITFLTLSAD